MQNIEGKAYVLTEMEILDIGMYVQLCVEFEGGKPCGSFMSVLHNSLTCT
jgi:hypothetical protein